MRRKLHRRDFLQLSALGLGALTLPTALIPNARAANAPSGWQGEGSENISRSSFQGTGVWSEGNPRLPAEDQLEALGIGRVTIDQISVFQEPDLKSPRLRTQSHDKLLTLISTLVSPYGPPLNPRWYRVVGGYCHSAYLQRVETAHENAPQKTIREGGQLGEITVPYSQAFIRQPAGWAPVYRLYFESVHWVSGIDPGPDGAPWYRIYDELLRIEYHAPAHSLRLIPDIELTPLSPEVPPGQKRVEVSLLDQTLTAYEGDKIVLQAKVSTGLPNFSGVASEIPTDTPRGSFTIDPKMPSKHMGDGRLTSALDAYELPGVPWVSFFHYEHGVAFHGTYWHDNFGARMSHGCVNMRTADARWLYRWSLPVPKPTLRDNKGYGTRVVVR